jgi:hypothetical protein
VSDPVKDPNGIQALLLLFFDVILLRVAEQRGTGLYFFNRSQEKRPTIIRSGPGIDCKCFLFVHVIS